MYFGMLVNTSKQVHFFKAWQKIIETWFSYSHKSVLS